MFNYFNIKMSKSHGFTLVEIGVVVTIIIILAIVTMPFYQKANYQLALQRSANKLAQDIRRVQEMAMSVKECDGCGAGFDGEYGIYFDKTNGHYSYLIYAELGGSPNFYSSAQDVLIEGSYTELEEGAYIKWISANPAKLNISFIPPDPTIKIKWSAVGGEQDETTITIGFENLSITKDIKVNKAGLVYVQ